MKRSKAWATAAGVLLICGISAFFFFRNRNQAEDELPDMLQEAWVPYLVVEEEASPLDGFLFGQVKSTDNEEGKASSSPSSNENLTKGLPAGYPENLIPLIKIREIDEGYTYGEDGEYVVQYFSTATYEEAVKFYKDKLGDKKNFKASEESEQETWMSCKVKNYEIEVLIYGSDVGDISIQINVFDNSYREE